MWISHALINHLLLQQAELKQALSKLTGRSLRLTALGVNTDMHIREDGYVEAIPADKTFECHISIHASTWSKMVQGEAFGVGDVSITGDTDLAMQLLPVLGQLRYEPYVDATRLFGNTVASHLDHQLKSLWRNTQQMVSRVEGEVRDYLQESDTPLVSQEQWQQRNDDIDALRDDVARLQARLQRLE